MAALTSTHEPSLAEAARQIAEKISAGPAFEDFYLAGSAALALYLGHRPVSSLDWMSAHNRLTGPERRDLLQELLALDGTTRVETARDKYLFVRLGETPIRFFYYPYPLVDPLAEWQGVEVASAVDLGLMKLGAIISRGHLKDFVDLYLLCRQVPLEELLERAPGKFGHVRDFPLQALKGLADWSMTEGEPMPRLAEPMEREAVESWCRGEVRRLGRKKVGLAP